MPFQTKCRGLLNHSSFLKLQEPTRLQQSALVWNSHDHLLHGHAKAVAEKCPWFFLTPDGTYQVRFCAFRDLDLYSTVAFYRQASCELNHDTYSIWCRMREHEIRTTLFCLFHCAIESINAILSRHIIHSNLQLDMVQLISLTNAFHCNTAKGTFFSSIPRREASTKC